MSEPEETRDPRIADKFLQKPAFNAYERLLCSHLIEAVTAEPLKAVMHVTRAALSVSRDAADHLEIDQEKAKSLFTIAQRLVMTPQATDDNTLIGYSVHTETLDWEIDLLPWVRMTSYETLLNDDEVNEWEDIKEDGDKVQLFHYATAHLSPEGYRHLVADFLFYAMNITEDMTRKMAETINAETYTALLKMYRGDKP